MKKSPHSPASLGNAFFWKGGRIGCLLVHGLTSTPQEMENLGRFLHKKGYTIHAPLLAGHHTHEKDLSLTSWEDWYASISLGYQKLSAHCNTLFIIGQSIGGTLALHLAFHHPRKLKGIVLLSPAIFYSNRLVSLASFLWPFKPFAVKDYRAHYPHRDHSYFDIADDDAYRERIAYTCAPLRSLSQALSLIRKVKRELFSIRQPILILHSRNDHTIRPESSTFIHGKIGSEKKSLKWLFTSGHVISVDIEKEMVFESINNFIEGLTLSKNIQKKKLKKQRITLL